jgi:preprotein translocase subunit YajC
MLISPAYAQTGGLGGFDLVSLMPLVLIFVVFYFLLIRPQQKKQKAHREMIGAVRRGDNVLTNGGIFGRVTKVVDDDRLQVEIADNVRVHVARSMISEVMTRTEPVKETRDRDNKKSGSGGKKIGSGDKDKSASGDKDKEDGSDK